MTHPSSTNSLLQLLQKSSPEFMSAFERVSLVAGQWPEQAIGSDGFMYFPEDGLLALSVPAADGVASAARGTRLALLGCHHVWSPGQMPGSRLQARVLVAGQAMRVSEAFLRRANSPLGLWWLQVAASTQKWMHQMAHMAACTLHHSASENLASWLLIARHNSPNGQLQIPLAALRDWLGMSAETWQGAWQGLQHQQALELVGQGASSTIQVKAPLALSGLACACHRTPGPG